MDRLLDEVEYVTNGVVLSETIPHEEGDVILIHGIWRWEHCDDQCFPKFTDNMKPPMIK